MAALDDRGGLDPEYRSECDILNSALWAKETDLGPGILATFRNAFWPVFWPVLATFDIITENQLSTPNFSVLIYCVLATFRYVTQLLFELLF